MSEIHSFGVRQLRSFGETRKTIPLKKLNIYVGRNSCGKSTFLRTFPLLRQSVESDTRSPILWYGGYVDFGDFSTALHNGSKEIYFDFDLNLDPAEALTSQAATTPWENFSFSHSRQPLESFSTKLTIGLEKTEKEAIRTTVSFEISSAQVQLTYSGTDVAEVLVTCNTSKRSEVYNPTSIRVKGSLIPKSVCSYKELSLKLHPDKTIKRIAATDVLQIESMNRMAKYLSTFHHRAKLLKNIRSAIVEIPLCSGERLISHLRSVFHKDKHFLNQLTENKKEIAHTCFQFLLAKYIHYYWSAADELISNFFRGVRYLGPLRASAERFYRHQDLQIGEVDHTGSNLPMVINSLEPRRKRELSDWVFENFGFKLQLETAGLHYALKIQEEHDDRFYNVSDMGFGYSQILPVIVSIWLEMLNDSRQGPQAGARNRKKTTRTLVIEQPELHLHPALQYKFGLAIAKVASISDGRFTVVIETHSKHLIDALGSTIRNKEISEADVNISLFEKDHDNCTSVSFSGFDDEGYLVNWPAGFLSA